MTMTEQFPHVIDTHHFQEAEFSWFDNEEEESYSDLNSISNLHIHKIPFPQGQKLRPIKNLSKGKKQECYGSGKFCYRSLEWRDRFICWRVFTNMLVLKELNLHGTLSRNTLRFQFPSDVIPTGVYVTESWEKTHVLICVLTNVGSLYRFSYKIDEASDKSIFASENMLGVSSNVASVFNFIQSLQDGEVVTSCLWINEFNLVLGSDTGRFIGINMGFPSRKTEGLQEFVFSDESVMKWLWNGLVKSGKWSGGSCQDEFNRQCKSIVAISSLSLKSEESEGDSDLYLFTLSADLTIRVWSFRTRTCLGNRHLRGVIPSFTGASTDFEEDGSLDLVTSAHLYIVPGPHVNDNDRGAYRFVLHIETGLKNPQEIYLLRGELASTSPDGTLALDCARSFPISTVDTLEKRSKRKYQLRLVSFAVEKNSLYSCWRSSAQGSDFLFFHPNALTFTGPRLVPGFLISSLDDRTIRWQEEDRQWSFQLNERSDEATIDKYFLIRLFIPGRFTTQNVAKALEEFQVSDLTSKISSSGSLMGSSVKLNERIVRAISNRCIRLQQQIASENPTLDLSSRIELWQEFLSLCIKYWRCEHVAIGLSYSKVLGSAFVLRRNRISLLVPASSSIARPLFLPPSTVVSREVIEDIHEEILPVFGRLPSAKSALECAVNKLFVCDDELQGFSDDDDKSLMEISLHAVRLGLTTSSDCSVELTRALLHLRKLLTGDDDYQVTILNQFVHYLHPTPRPEDVQMHDENTVYRSFFNGSDISFAFHHITTDVLDEMCLRAAHAVLFLGFLIETRPAFLSQQALDHISLVGLPSALTSYRKWKVSKWICQQASNESSSVRGSLFIAPPLFQSLLMDSNVNGELNKALVAIPLVPMQLLVVYSREIVAMLSAPAPQSQLLMFLKKKKQYKLLRILFSFGFDRVWSKVESLRNIAECLAHEGAQLVRCGNDSRKDYQRAGHCFAQAVRCFSMALLPAIPTTLQLIPDSILVLKECISRGFEDSMLQFLWSCAGYLDSCEEHDKQAIEGLVWLNLFKYSLDQQRFRDAHVALMRLVAKKDKEAEAMECVGYLVKELLRANRLDLVTELQWGYLEKQVEELVFWHASNVDVLQEKDSGLNSKALLYYQLLYSFYTRKSQHASAAGVMYGLYLRLKLSKPRSKCDNLFEHQPDDFAAGWAFIAAQRNALFAALQALLLVPEDSRWIVRKYHAEELAQHKASGTTLLGIVTVEDVQKEVILAEAKLHYLKLTSTLHVSSSWVVISMDAPEIATLLIDATRIGTVPENGVTLSERRSSTILTIEIVIGLVQTWKLGLDNTSRSIARICLSCNNASSTFAWEILEKYLTMVDDKEQYEIVGECFFQWTSQKSLPLWLRNSLSTKSPSKLLSIYLQQGLLLDALELAKRILPEHIMNESESEFQKRARSHEALPWIPYNLIDALLDACRKVGETHGWSTQDDEQIMKAGVKVLSESLTCYFRYVDRLDQARNVVASGRQAVAP